MYHSRVWLSVTFFWSPQTGYHLTVMLQWRHVYHVIAVHCNHLSRWICSTDDETEIKKHSWCMHESGEFFLTRYYYYTNEVSKWKVVFLYASLKNYLKIALMLSKFAFAYVTKWWNKITRKLFEIFSWSQNGGKSVKISSQWLSGKSSHSKFDWSSSSLQILQI